MTLKQVDFYQTIFFNKVSPFTCMEQKNACYIYLFIYFFKMYLNKTSTEILNCNPNLYGKLMMIYIVINSEINIIIK